MIFETILEHSRREFDEAGELLEAELHFESLLHVQHQEIEQDLFEVRVVLSQSIQALDEDRPEEIHFYGGPELLVVVLCRSGSTCLRSLFPKKESERMSVILLGNILIQNRGI